MGNQTGHKTISFSGPFLPIIRKVGRIAREQSLPAFVVGGFVRDTLLQRRSLDCDIVVQGDALSFARRLKKAFKAESLTLYPVFGTATLRLAGGRALDIATARKEVYPRPGALPVVSSGTIAEDLFRRDITINALAVSILPSTFGQLLDPFGGRADLRKKRIRVLHDQSFRDDPTRILRAVRYEQRFGFCLGRLTLNLLRDALRGGAVKTVKPARYFAEFRRVFQEADPAAVLKRLALWGGLNFLARDFVLDVRVLNKTAKMLSGKKFLLSCEEQERSGVFLLVLAQSCPVASREGWGQRFHLTRREQALLRTLPRVPELKKALSRSGLAPSQVFNVLSGVPLEIICFMRAQCSGKIISSYLEDELFCSRFVCLKISGNDLAALGCPSGRAMGRILREVHARKLDGRMKTRRDELACAKDLLRKG